MAFIDAQSTQVFSDLVNVVSDMQGSAGDRQQIIGSLSPRVTLRQLQCLCAVVDFGFNLSRTANGLHVTHTVVGMQLNQLERELGAALLVRHRGRIIGLTERGERTIPWARRAVRYAHNIRSLARDSQGSPSGSIDVATGHTYANHVLLPAVLAFTRRFPDLSIHLLHGGASDQVVNLVRDGQATIGVTQLTVDLPRDIVAVPLLEMRQVLLTPPDHPLLNERQLTLEKIAAYPLLVLSSSYSDADVLRTFEKAGVGVNVAMNALDTGVIKTYVATGVGIAVVPAVCYCQHRDANLRVREVDELFEAPVSAVILRRQCQLGHVAYAFLEMLDQRLSRQHVDEFSGTGGQ